MCVAIDDADRERESRVRCGVSGGGRGQAGGADCRVAPQRRCHGASLGLELGLDGGSGFSDDQDGLRCRDPRDLSLVVAGWSVRCSVFWLGREFVRRRAKSCSRARSISSLARWFSLALARRS